MPAEHLDAQLRGLVAGLGEEALGDRREQRQTAFGRGAIVGRGAVVQHIDQLGAGVGEHASALGIGLLGEQHAPHIRVGDDRICWLLGPQARCGAHLYPFAGIAEGSLEGSLGVALALLSHGQARLVDKGEHGIQTTVGLAQ
ncbi:hypothetical protein FQZ97_715500 [compost metagenome]